MTRLNFPFQREDRQIHNPLNSGLRPLARVQNKLTPPVISAQEGEDGRSWTSPRERKHALNLLASSPGPESSVPVENEEEKKLRRLISYGDERRSEAIHPASHYGKSQ
jgi:hypothetical protein